MKRIILALAGLALALAAVAGCAKSASSSPAATFAPAASSLKAAASSLRANPTVSNDVTATEQQLLSNLQATFSPMHPVQSVKAAVRATFPQGDTAKIESYAVKTFSLKVIHTHGPGSARDLWAQGVILYAQSQGAHAATPAPSPAANGTGASS